MPKYFIKQESVVCSNTWLDIKQLYKYTIFLLAKTKHNKLLNFVSIVFFFQNQSNETNYIVRSIRVLLK